ncbi:MAG: hypothetical protein KGJ55_05935 [Gammaproteobacteria bacterium]|nr:hypothetical protein [Gammaproteobacteria bacterium]
MTTVTLNVKLKDGYLDVDQSGNGNQIAHGQSVTIQWQLTGDAASGSFNSQSAANPGFTWKQDPPDGVFGTPTPNGNRLTITDANTSTGSVGTWIYQLWASVNGTQYSTDNPSPKRTMTDPTIKNL